MLLSQCRENKKQKVRDRELSGGYDERDGGGGNSGEDGSEKRWWMGAMVVVGVVVVVVKIQIPVKKLEVMTPIAKGRRILAAAMEITFWLVRRRDFRSISRPTRKKKRRRPRK
ncbi:hypothetical protein YC2023_117940 [Brassica napus]